MADESLVPAVELDDAGWAVLTDAVRRFEDLWRSAAAADLADFVPGLGEPLRGPVLIELIKVDQEYRWKRGEPKNVEQYLAEWPELIGNAEISTELVQAECLTRACLNSLPTREDLDARFPELAGRIDLPAIAVEVERGRATACSSAAMVETPTTGPLGTSAHALAPPVMPGGRLFGRYEIKSLVGRGGMGTVYRAFDTHLHREVALKVPHFDPSGDSAIIERFLREGRAAAKIWHPNVCPILDAGQIEGKNYLTMKLVEGQSLAERLKHGKMEPREAAAMVEKLARGLEAVHAAGIAHRDIKSANVMLDPSGEPLLMDFGLARQAEPDALVSASGSLMGTPAFMSPEQAAGEAIDARSDVYSLGVVLYQALTGRLPFEGPLSKVLAGIASSVPPLPHSLCPDVPGTIEAVCMKAMAKLPADRYASAREFAEALCGYLQGDFQGAVPPWRRRGWAWVAGAGAAAVFLTGVIISIRIHRDDEKVKGIDIEVSTTESPKVPGVKKGARGESPRGLPEPSLAQAPLIPIERWIGTSPTAAAVAIAPDGSRLYAAACLEEGSSPIYVYDAASGEPLATIPFDGEAYVHKGIAVSGDGRFLFVTNYHARDISRIDLRQGNARTDLPVRGAPGPAFAQGLTVTPDGQKLLVTVGGDGRSVDLDNDQISIVDIGDGRFSLLGEVKLQDEAIGQRLAVIADGRLGYFVTAPRKSNAPMLYEISLTEPYCVTRSLAFREGKLGSVVASSRLRRAFVSDSAARKIWVVDLAPLKVTSAIELEDYAPGTLGFTRDEDLLSVICHENRKLFFVNPADGTVVSRVEGLRESPGGVVLAPDNTRVLVPHGGPRGGTAVVDLRRRTCRIVFASNRAGESYQLYTMDGEGKDVRRLTQNRSTDRLPRWSPDGRWIAFVSDRGGPARVCVTRCDQEAAAVFEATDPGLVEPGFGPQLDWSVDGTEIVFIGNGWRALRVLNLKSGEIRTLLEGDVAPGISQYDSVCWQRDGRVLFSARPPANAHQKEVFRIDLKTGKVTKITKDLAGSEHYASPAASPDGRRIAMARHANRDPPPSGPIFLIGADGSGPIAVESTAATLNMAPRWSADGRAIVYIAKAGPFHHINAAPAEGGKPVALTSSDCDDIDPDVWGDAPARDSVVQPTQGP